MKPILYSDTETVFDTNGLGMLSDAISANVSQVLNGMYELTLKYPVGGIHSELIEDRSIIVTKPDPISTPQPFRVYRIIPSSNGVIKVYARHIAYDTMGIPVSPFEATGPADAMEQLKRHTAVDCPFTFYTDKSLASDFKVETPKEIWNVLGGSRGSLLDIYGGEYEFDRYSIYLRTKRGTDRGVTIRYGKNLKTLEQDRNCAECYTGVYPYWLSSDEENRVLVQLPEKVIHADGDFNYTRILDLDLSMEWEEAPTEEQLRGRAKKYIADNKIGVPDVSWTITFAALEQSEEYKGLNLLESIYLGDTVSVIFPVLHIDVSARAVETDFDSILERYNSVTLGKVKSSLTSTLVRQQQEIEAKPSSDAVKRAAELATQLILGAKGGAVRYLDTDGDGVSDTIYVADNSDPNLAKKVWRWNYEGWGASTNGYDGPFKMAATLDAGLLADFVTAAHLTTGTIRSRNGSVFIDLDSGTFRATAIDNLNTDMDDLDQAVSDTNNELKNNYSTTVQMEAAIQAAADRINLSVSKTYITTDKSNADILQAKSEAASDATAKANAAKSAAATDATNKANAAQSAAATDATAKANAAKDAATKHTDDALKNYSTTVQMEAAIKIAVDRINLSVSKTYVTTEKSNADILRAKSEAASDATAKANAAQSAATKHTDNALKNYSTTVQMEAAIKIVADQISSKVSRGDVESIISQKADSIRMKASKISWESTYSSMTEDGRLTCSSANIKGDLECSIECDGFTNWIKIKDGCITGGVDDMESCTITCVGTSTGLRGVSIIADCISLDGTIYAYDGTGVWSRGYTGTIPACTELWLGEGSNGHVNGWSYTMTDLEFVNGILVSGY